MTSDVIVVFILLVSAFTVATVMTPVLTNFLYRHRLGKQIRDPNETPIYSALHAQKAGTPTMAGVLVWGSTLAILIILWMAARFLPTGFWQAANFLSRSETYLPLGMMLLAAGVGMVDDLYNIRRRGAHGGGLRVRQRIVLFALIAAVGAWWFVTKLDWTTLHLPFYGNIDIGWWYAPLFMFVIVATGFSVDITDGLDGLAGGLMLLCFMAYGAIAFLQGHVELASFIAVITGSLAAFLWFNIPPARFFMGDTGAMGLGVTLGVIAMLTNSALLLPIIGLPFVIESLSVIIQVVSKRFWKRKVFISAPIHHHLEAKGWSEPKIVMRFWIVGGMSAAIGLTLFLIDRL